jgi:phosphate uptake regulator
MQATQSPFDINALFSAAILNAVNAATAPLMERIELLERSLVVADKAAQGNESDLSSRLSLLEDRFDNITIASDERIKEIADEVARDVLSEHNNDYDHDEYDRLFNDLGDKVNDAVNDAIDDLDISDKINDALNGATVSISV